MCYNDFSLPSPLSLFSSLPSPLLPSILLSPSLLFQGYNRKREYIAAQGPLPDTLGDFWRMVWEYNVPTVIMLTNLVEKAKVKCSQYWPNKGTIDYGNISVTLINTVTHADFVLRQFTIKNVSDTVVILKSQTASALFYNGTSQSEPNTKCPD